MRGRYVQGEATTDQSQNSDTRILAEYIARHIFRMQRLIGHPQEATAFHPVASPITSSTDCCSDSDESQRFRQELMVLPTIFTTIVV